MACLRRPPVGKEDLALPGAARRHRLGDRCARRAAAITGRPTGKNPTGKNRPVPNLTGIHHVVVPASDPMVSSDWYVQVFGFAAVVIEEQENEVVAVVLEHPCGARLVLRNAAELAVALRGYPLFGLAVASRAELLQWVDRLATLDVEHSAVHPVQLGWAVTVTGPDMVRIQLHTTEGPSGEAE